MQGTQTSADKATLARIKGTCQGYSVQFVQSAVDKLQLCRDFAAKAPMVFTGRKYLGRTIYISNPQSRQRESC